MPLLQVLQDKNTTIISFLKRSMKTWKTTLMLETSIKNILTNLPKVTESSSKDVCMAFGLDKCKFKQRKDEIQLRTDK